MLKDCVATAALPKGDLTAQGIVTSKSGAPQPSTLVVTGGTGSYLDAHGTVKVSFGKQYDTLTINVN